MIRIERFSRLVVKAEHPGPHARAPGYGATLIPTPPNCRNDLRTPPGSFSILLLLSPLRPYRTTMPRQHD